MSNKAKKKILQAIVMGVSAGGLNALTKFVSNLKPPFNLPIIIVAHRHRESDDFLSNYLNNFGIITVLEAKDKMPIQNNIIYIAPPDYHLLVERSGCFSLSNDELVNFSRPSIDVLFESAVDAYQDRLMGIILTGANSDGAIGIKLIEKMGGIPVVQDPKEAEVDSMPHSAINKLKKPIILSLTEISNLVNIYARKE